MHIDDLTLMIIGYLPWSLLIPVALVIVLVVATRK